MQASTRGRAGEAVFHPRPYPAGASPEVVEAGDKCCRFLIDLYIHENMTVDEISMAIRDADHPLNGFSVACRKELDRFVIKVARKRSLR